MEVSVLRALVEMDLDLDRNGPFHLIDGPPPIEGVSKNLCARDEEDWSANTSPTMEKGPFSDL